MGFYYERSTDEFYAGRIIVSTISFLAFLTTLGMWGCPTYLVWQQSLEGKAQLQKAEYTRQVAIVEADAKRRAAVDLAGAEVERAKGVARANEIIGQSLKNNEAYLRWLWIEGIQTGKEHQVIYVPTEAGIPILEATRLQR